MGEDRPHEKVGILVRPAELIQELLLHGCRSLFMGSTFVYLPPEKSTDFPVLDHHTVVALAPLIVALKVVVELEGNLAGRLLARGASLPQADLLKRRLERRFPLRIVRRNDEVMHLLRLEYA